MYVAVHVGAGTLHAMLQHKFDVHHGMLLDNTLWLGRYVISYTGVVSKRMACR